MKYSDRILKYIIKIYLVSNYCASQPLDKALWSSGEETRPPKIPTSTRTSARPYWLPADYIGQPEKIIFQTVTEELFLDAMNKMHQVHSITQQHKDMMPVAFEIGVIIGLIRGQYRRMMETYREVRDRSVGRGYIHGPYNDYYRKYVAEHYLVRYENIHQLELDIEHHIDMLENFPINRIEKFDKFLNQPRYNPMPSVLRRRNDEQILKRRMKKDYILRKLKERREGARTDDFEFKGKTFETYLPDQDIWYTIEQE